MAFVFRLLSVVAKRPQNGLQLSNRFQMSFTMRLLSTSELPSTAEVSSRRERFLHLQVGTNLLLKDQFKREAISREEFMKHTRVLTKYVFAVEDSVDTVTTIKEHFLDMQRNIKFFTPSTYEKLSETSTNFARDLVKHLREQNELLAQVVAIIRSISLPNKTESPVRLSAALSITTDIEPLQGSIAFGLDIIQLLCKMKTAWSTQNQSAVEAAAEELEEKFLSASAENKKEFNKLRGAIDRLRCYLVTQQDPVVKELIQQCIDVATEFEMHFFGLARTLQDTEGSSTSQ